jgi:hypothetical protein
MKSEARELPSNWSKFLNISSFALSAISLLADILGIGKIAYDVVVVGNLADLGFRLIILVLVFLFGIGLGLVAIRGFNNTRVVDMAKFYSWVYVAIACLSYLGVSFALRRHDYAFGTYFAFVVVILSQLLAIKGIQIAIEEDMDIRKYSIPILSVCLIHAVLIVYTYIFAAVPASVFLAGDLLFFTGMTLVGSAMLGDIGFRTLVLRIYREARR